MFDLQSSQYFQSLPAYVRETIMQSGKDFKTEEELRVFARHIENPAK